MSNLLHEPFYLRLFLRVYHRLHFRLLKHFSGFLSLILSTAVGAITIFLFQTAVADTIPSSVQKTQYIPYSCYKIQQPLVRSSIAYELKNMKGFCLLPNQWMESRLLDEKEPRTVLMTSDQAILVALFQLEALPFEDIYPNYQTNSFYRFFVMEFPNQNGAQNQRISAFQLFPLDIEFNRWTGNLQKFQISMLNEKDGILKFSNRWISLQEESGREEIEVDATKVPQTAPHGEIVTEVSIQAMSAEKLGVDFSHLIYVFKAKK